MATSLITNTMNSLDHRVVIATPRKWKRDGTKPGIIFIPGTDETYKFAVLPNQGQPVVQQLLDAGYPVAAFQASSTVGGIGNLWANDACYAMIAAMRTYLQSSAVGAKAGKIGLVGLSQGALDVLAWAGQNPTLTGGVTAYLPNTDLAATAAHPTYGASVDSAYGGNYVQGTHGATHSPITQAGLGKFAGVPINLVYASNDPVIAPTYPQQFAAAVGSNAVLIDGGATGHAWPITLGAAATSALLTQMASV